MINVEDIGGGGGMCSVSWGDIIFCNLSTVAADIVIHVVCSVPLGYSNNKRSPPTVLMVFPHGTHDIPHGTKHTLYRVIVDNTFQWDVLKKCVADKKITMTCFRP